MPDEPNDKPTSAGTEQVTAGNREVLGYVLFVCGGAAEDRGKTLKLESGEALLGTADDCDLVLTDSTVSRQHVRLTVLPDGLRVSDLDSTNGTKYLGQTIERAVIHSGARLMLGNLEIDILPLSDSAGVPIAQRDSYGDLMGSSDAMRRVYSLLEMLENSSVPTLIDGETGTGKELVARALFEHGPRKEGPFIIIDCANIPSQLMESELFGHKKGSFTGAMNDRDGAFQSADGGTLFLDEIGELPLELQSKLLRALETGEVKRVGENEHKKVDVRVVAATHRELAEAVRKGEFREDLFFRIAVVRIHLPALRDRREDILPLAEKIAAGVGGGHPATLPPAATDFFVRYDWPGNVRELRNAVHRILAIGVAGLSESQMLTDGTAKLAPDLATESTSLDYREGRDRAVFSFEQTYLRDLLGQFEGNLSAAARAAGIDRKSLRLLLKKHGLYDES